MKYPKFLMHSFTALVLAPFIFSSCSEDDSTEDSCSLTTSEVCVNEACTYFVSSTINGVTVEYDVDKETYDYYASGDVDCWEGLQ
ncbi:hypothetical protein OAD06_07735 [Flavobacteriaceae bacterium]|nr:hypothetical protein [bacterium]MDA9342244.1 hypothetical protein [Flavobacteriaceae bacterium]MDB9914174.1 hypothetical protein [Flavobacteriaceae bacterium]MDB9993826.1 hypothetical protein [Flavobacteriaceae bacterium]